MPNKPLLVFCLRPTECPIARAMREAVGGPSNGHLLGHEVPRIAARVLRSNPYPGQGHTELWIRVSGDKDALNAFMGILSRMKGVYYQLIYENKFNKLLRVVLRHDSSQVCPRAGEGFCPLVHEAPGLMLKSTIIIPGALLQEYIVARSQFLDTLSTAMKCEIVDSRPLDEMDYMLTQKQELALVYAYLSGYYSFPRRVSLKTLAERLGLSVSTLAEFLRRAEAKVVEAFIRHELPHYMAAVILHGHRSFRSIEEALRGERAREPAAAEAAAPA